MHSGIQTDMLRHSISNGMAWHISFNPMFGIVARAWDYRKWEELFWTMGCCLCGWVSSPSPSPPISPCSPSGSNISDSESRIHSFNARIVLNTRWMQEPYKNVRRKKKKKGERAKVVCVPVSSRLPNACNLLLVVEGSLLSYGTQTTPSFVYCRPSLLLFSKGHEGVWCNTSFEIEDKSGSFSGPATTYFQ